MMELLYFWIRIDSKVALHYRLLFVKKKKKKKKERKRERGYSDKSVGPEKSTRYVCKRLGQMSSRVLPDIDIFPFFLIQYLRVSIYSIVSLYISFQQYPRGVFQSNIIWQYSMRYIYIYQLALARWTCQCTAHNHNWKRNEFAVERPLRCGNRSHTVFIGSQRDN